MSAPQPSVLSAGCEWIVDASGCDPERLRSVAALRALVARLIDDLALRPVGLPVWHTFPTPGGVTGLVLLSESHVACHTFPENGFATFNLYCCQPRADWPWASQLRDHLGASEVVVRRLERGAPVAAAARTQPA